MAITYCLLASFFLLSSSVKIRDTLTLDFALESIQYDSQSDVYWISNDIDFTLEAYDPKSLEQLEEMTLADDSENGDYNNETYLQLPTAHFRYPNSDLLYVNSALVGRVLAFNITTSEIVYDIYLGKNQFPNGMCYNPDNDRIYVTDTGISFVNFSLTGNQQIFELTPELEITRTFLSDNENIYPNGCDVRDDDLYVCQTNNIISNAPVYKFVGLTTNNMSEIPSMEVVGDFSKYQARADGLKFDNDWNLYISSWGDGGTTDGFLAVLEDGAENFTLYVENLNSPADIGFDDKRDLILIPAFTQPTGSVDIVRSLSYDSSSNGKPFDKRGWFIGVMCLVGVVGLVTIGVILYTFRNKLCGERERRDSQYEAFESGNEML